MVLNIDMMEFRQLIDHMLKKFQQTSDEKFSDLKKKNMDVRRPKRGAVSK